MTPSRLLDSPVNVALSEHSVVANSELDVGSDVAIPNPLDVERYLSDHATLRSLVPRICERVRAEFGNAAELSLELYRDPEIDDRYLSLDIRQDRYESDIIARLDRLSEEFATELEQCSGDILLTTDFRPRRSQHAV